MDISTAFLADHPEHLRVVADWLYREWGARRPGNTLAATRDRLATHCQRDALPLTVIALDGPTCVGCASLRLTDLAGREDLGPWLASVYVVPERRRRGIGARVVREAEAAARRIGLSTLYLFTPDRQSFYQRLGWVECERAVARGEPVSVMRRSLVTPTVPHPPSAHPARVRHR